MKLLQQISLFTLLTSMLACSGPQSTETTEAPEAKCSYTFNEGSVNVKWTAFKTTEKIGVSGTFDTISVTGIQSANSAIELFSNAGFSIPVSSVNSNNPDRDKKILASFFGSMLETTTLSGKVVGITDNDCSVVINMNGVSDTCIFNLTHSDSAISLVSSIELGNWNALASADSLNQICFDLHKGADGVSKLWPDVKLEITAGITETCD